MEYLLQLEQSQKHKLLFFLIGFIILFIVASTYVLGIKGFALSTGLTSFFLLIPLFIKQYKFFMILWILIIPFIDNIRFLMVGEINVLTYIATGITFPVAMVLIYREVLNIKKLFPFALYVIVFLFIVLLNGLRPNASPMELFGVIKFHFIEIFVIICTIYYLKMNKAVNIFKLMNIVIFANSLIAIFQRFTGIGLRIVEGVPRAAGLTVHPNALGLIINVYFPIGLYLFMNAENKREKFFYGLTMLTSLIGLIFTYTKVSYATMGMSLIVLFLFLPFKYKIRLGLTFAFLSLAFCILNFIFGLEFFNYLLSRFENTSSFEWRLKVWGYLIANMDFISVLIGKGINQAQHTLYKINPFESIYVHNAYLQMLYDYGVAGVLYFINIFITGLWFLKKSLTTKIKEDKFLFILPFLSAISIVINAATDNTNTNRVAIIYFWVTSIIFYYYSINPDILKRKNKN